MSRSQQRAKSLLNTKYPWLHCKAYSDAMARYLAAGNDIAKTANNWHVRYYGTIVNHDDCA